MNDTTTVTATASSALASASVTSRSGRTIHGDDLTMQSLCNGDQVAVGGSSDRATYIINAAESLDETPDLTEVPDPLDGELLYREYRYKGSPRAGTVVVVQDADEEEWRIEIPLVPMDHLMNPLEARELAHLLIRAGSHANRLNNNLLIEKAGSN